MTVKINNPFFVGNKLAAALLFLLVISAYFNVSAQSVRPEIDSLMHLITTESYSAHFDPLRTGEDHNRKVVAEKHQSEDHDASRDYIYQSLQHYLGSSNVYLHRFKSKKRKGLTNVIGIKKGNDPKAGVWVVGAHYDTNNNGTPKHENNDAAPGANDNGTGLAALLELARIVSGVETSATVLFSAWDFEEIFTNGKPTGSNKWYKKHVKKKRNTEWNRIAKGGMINRQDVRGNINFDMIGNPQVSIDQKPVLWACYASGDEDDFVKRYAEVFNSYVTEVTAIISGPLNLSDHYTFASNGIPAVLNLESGYVNDPFYHTHLDHRHNPDNIDYEFATWVARGGLAFLLEEVLSVGAE